MKKPVDISGGWKAIPVEGGGVIVQGENGLVAVEWAYLNADVNLENRWEKKPAVKSVVLAKGPAAIEEFLEATNLRDLGADGIYGPLGPTVKKFRDVLKTIEAGSALADTAGEFLATGDHLRHGPVAALVSLKNEQVTVVNLAIDSGDVADLEHVMDRFVVGNAAEAVA